MAKKHHPRTGGAHRRPRSGGSDRNDNGFEGNGNEHEHEPYDNPAVHREIENNRFRGGLAPTPELYARAREQWYRLPGSLVRPSMDPVLVDSGTGQQDLPEKK